MGSATAQLSCASETLRVVQISGESSLRRHGDERRTALKRSIREMTRCSTTETPLERRSKADEHWDPIGRGAHATRAIKTRALRIQPSLCHRKAMPRRKRRPGNSAVEDPDRPIAQTFPPRAAPQHTGRFPVTTD